MSGYCPDCGNTFCLCDDITKSTYPLRCEIEKLQAEIERYKSDYKKDMDIKDRMIKHLESECRRVFEPTREFWNNEKLANLQAERKELVECILALEEGIESLMSANYSGRFAPLIEKLKAEKL